MTRADVVRKLRAKAASTTFPHEAETLRAHADRIEAKLHRERPPMARRPVAEAIPGMNGEVTVEVWLNGRRVNITTNTDHQNIVVTATGVLIW